VAAVREEREGAANRFHDLMQGPVLAAVHLHLVFWGTRWHDQPSPTVAAVADAARSIVSGPYMTSLDQYRGVGPAR
jgi:hypothetical protein